ncbi:hypothetical protein TNCV_4399651 [Trichonephila clavipes]|nr:hypothetical protein TNCV_4399651 [Trichonephila clavipes]
MTDGNANTSYIIRAKKSCSGKTEQPFNRMVKIIFGIEKPLEDIIEDTMELIEAPPKRWQKETGTRHWTACQQLLTATGSQVSRFTVTKRLQKWSLLNRRPERCTPVAHR